jgi:hypothetical protein
MPISPFMGFALSGHATTDYCREIETYLCQKNQGHLIRVVGPSFEMVSGWMEQGVPLKVAFGGIDRCVERYHRKGLRRRPIKIDFCEADVLDAFDQWRRAIGLPAQSPEAVIAEPDAPAKTSSSLPAHLERVVRRLTTARATGKIDETFDRLIDQAARDLDLARSSAHGVRGQARQTLIDRLTALDLELLRTARAAVDEPARLALTSEAESELATFRSRMTPAVFARTREAAVDRLLRERFGLPTVTFSSQSG